MQASITSTPFGTLPDGRVATLYTLTNAQGLVIKITDFGGIITELHAPDRDGVLGDIVLGYDQLAPYVQDSPYFGALIGRFGNRLCEGQFEIDGERVQLPRNDGKHHLHGGHDGYHKVLWQAQPFQDGDTVGLTLRHRSPDGEQGYPGTLDVTVSYSWTGANALVLRFHAVTDKATPVNLTQHSYFNLAGSGDILGHLLSLDADRYTPIDATSIPLGTHSSVAGTAFDFRVPQPIGARIADDDPQLRNGSGYDHNFVLNPASGAPAVRLKDPASGRVLELYTEEPGIQFYSGNFLDGKLHGKGRQYAYRSGLCIEPQHFPDSPNQPSFPNTILRPGQEYATVSTYRFFVE